MSQDLTGDDDLEDTGPDCFTNVILVAIYPPGGDEPALVEEFEVISATPLSFEQIWARTQLHISQWLQALSQSPRFRERFGLAPRTEVLSFGSFHGC